MQERTPWDHVVPSAGTLKRVNKRHHILESYLSLFVSSATFVLASTMTEVLKRVFKARKSQVCPPLWANFRNSHVLGRVSPHL